MSRGTRARHALFFLLVFGITPARAQTYSRPTGEAPLQYPPPLPPRRGPSPPPLRFVQVAEIPVPGPLPGGSLRLEGEGVRVPLAQGEAIVPLSPGAPAQVLQDGISRDPSSNEDWTLAPDGRHRYGAPSPGFIEAERRCRLCKRGWNRMWRVRVGAAVPSAPLVFGRRVCYAALDNQVYCLRADNGHRAWATDVGDRVSRPLALWTGPAHPEGDASVGTDGSPVLQLLLVVPDGGEALLALDTYDGRRLAAYEIPASQGRLVSSAVVAPDGRVAVARQGYQDQEAAIEVLALVAAEERPASGDHPAPYNNRPQETSGPGEHLPVP
jgi:putative pyrroloquinoline-quinone binding quinoprotein